MHSRRIALILLNCFALVSSLSARGLGADVLGTQGGDKISGDILLHRREKLSARALSAIDQRLHFETLGFRARELDAEECALYVRERLAAGDIADLARRGVRVNPKVWIPPLAGRHPHGYHLAHVDYTSLEVVRRDARIVRLESAETLTHPQSDIARVLTAVEQLHSAAPPVMGEGVKIAIADSGLDLTHPDIPTPVEAYDVTDGDTVDEWSTDVRNLAIPHGTLVAGIAVGSGQQSSGRYRGAAPGCRLHFYKIGDDQTGSASTADEVKAIHRAVEVGCRIFSMSYGGFQSYLDGSDMLSQAADVAASRGMQCFFSAGNTADDDWHVSTIVEPEADSDVIRFVIDNRQGNSVDTTMRRLSVIWRDGQRGDGNMTLSVQGLLAGESVSDRPPGTSTRGTEMRWYDLHPNVAAGSRRVYQLVLRNSATGGDAPLVHCYRIAGGAGRFLQPDPFYTVTSPALADSAVAVGCYTHRRSWEDWMGDSWHLEGYVVGEPAPFSSMGPRIDGLQKPDLLAPGAAIFSCRDSEPGIATRNSRIIDNDGVDLDGTGPAEYFADWGTSMAAPHAAGAAALLLEARPGVTPLELREALVLSASSAASPNDREGHGLVNAVGALELLPRAPLASVAVDDGSFENCLGLNAQGTRYYVNRLTPERYPATLNAVEVFFRHDAICSAPVGSPIRILVGAHPDGTGDIDGVELREIPATVRSLGEFNVYNVEDLTLESGDFVVGISFSTEGGDYPAALDWTEPQDRSYWSIDGVDFEPLGGSPRATGNWGFRARVATDEDVAPDIVTPLLVDLGEVFVGDRAEGGLPVENRGDAPLAVQRALVVGEIFTVSDPGRSFTVEAGAAAPVELAFTAESVGEQQAVLRLLSSDPDEPIVRVHLLGRSVPRQPAIELPVGHLKFGNVALGSSEERAISVLNVGSGALNVHDVRTDGDAFVVLEPLAPVTVEPGEEATVRVRFTPPSAGLMTAALSIESDDPDPGDARIEVTLSGAGLSIFHRGDVNDDGALDISDAVRLLDVLFLGGAVPDCLESSDANGDAEVDISDGIFLLLYLFVGGEPPVAPGPPGAACGVDGDAPGSVGDLGCDVYGNC